MNHLQAVFVVALEAFDNATLAAFCNALTGFGRVTKGCRAYAPALQAHLIEPDGKPVDVETLRSACAYEINQRVRAGTFQ